MNSSIFRCARGRAELTALLLLTIAAIAGFGGWFFGRHQSSSSQSALAGTQRKVAFYQSPMHPWIKSDQPGNCTICGMKLVPVYEGEKGLDESSMVGGVTLNKQVASTIQVETAEVKRQMLKRTIRVAGMIDDDDSAHRRLSAYVDGRIDNLHVNYVGAEVEAGQPLAAIYSRDLLVARSEYTLATKMAAGADRDSAISATRQKLRRMGLTLPQIEKLPSQTGDTFEIVAPISGTVVTRGVYEGQYVKEGDVLFEIADFSKMWFVFDAYERDLAWIRVGQDVEITTPSVPGKIYRAPISFIDPNLAEQTRTARIRVVMENPHVGDPTRHRHELLHKTYADGRISVESEPVLTVPRSSVLSPGGAPFVYVTEREGAYQLRRVLLGRVGDDVWEIVSGLEEGEKVVTTGNLLIDAQAQLDHGDAAPAAFAPAVGPLSAEQMEVARKFIDAVANAGAALSSDNLAQYNQRAPAVTDSTAKLANSLGKAGDRLIKLAILGGAKDLAAARTQFYPISMASADYASLWRAKSEEFSGLKIYECPMAKSAVPSAETNTGRWLQLAGPIRNPFFGAEMLECGQEVKR
ncbi:MAG TPA: efflux RND transporter periplasmic adaptor subunit [Chthoniobacteraceae bacterium]|nr:efflux RND transporter periplasmic adaptor subunit [Chthoniobacteraceae bacterium]